ASSRLARVRAEARQRLPGLTPEPAPLQQERARPNAPRGRRAAAPFFLGELPRRWRGLPSCPAGAPAAMASLETYARPSELPSLTVAQLAPPAGREGPRTCRAFCVHVEELGRPSETREFDLTALLDLERHPALILALRVFQRPRDRQECLFDISSRQLHCAFAGAAERPGVPQRGHWRSSCSVARYDKHARAPLQLGEPPVASQAEIAGVVERGARPFRALRQALAQPQPALRRVFLDLFSGSGSLARALAARNAAVLCIDIAQ
ncbi:unnamed protein product, partial [Prorocentrum cordatum]